MLTKFTRFLVILGLMAIISGTHTVASGQGFKSLKAAEDSLAAILTILNQTPEDSTKEKLNVSFFNSLYVALILPGADSYPFQSLKSLIKISSSDNKFTIYHWNLHSGRGKHKYFGFIKMLNREPSLVLPLNDFTDSISSPETAYQDNMHWFGALYYKIILCETNLGKQYYTLLGWAGKNTTITQKIIEILTFDDQSIPKFGLRVFPDFLDGKMTRIIFRYSASTSMSLKYEDQAIASDKKWNPKKRIFEFKTRTARMIVCDRLVPLDSQLDGQFQFYVAAGDVFDGFEFKNGNWNFIQGIDSRNKK